MTFTHICLLVRNYEMRFYFYRDVMQFEVVWGDPASSYAELRAGDGSLIAISTLETMAGVVNSSPSDADNAVNIFHVDDLESAVRDLEERGATFVAEIRDRPSWGVRTAHLRDPAGNLLELNSPL